MATVLLVEHELSLLEVLGEVLQRAGHVVLAAPTAESAIQAAQPPTGRIDVLLCDVLMGRVNGFEIAANVKSVHPEAMVILMSGAPTDDSSHGLVAHTFLQKPFALQELLCTIAQQGLAPDPHKDWN